MFLVFCRSGYFTAFKCSRKFSSPPCDSPTSKLYLLQNLHKIDSKILENFPLRENLNLKLTKLKNLFGQPMEINKKNRPICNNL